MKGLLLNDYGANQDGTYPDLSPFIATASMMVDTIDRLRATRPFTVSDVELEMIERWLAAHCYCQSDKPYSSKNTEGASAQFHGATGYDLTSSLYGQMAVSLDRSGTLGAMHSRDKRVASIAWVGKSAIEETSADQRGY